MGLVLAVVEFPYPAPKPEVIAEKVSELCGLKVNGVYQETDSGSLREFDASFTFDGHPDVEVEIYAYRSGAVRKHQEELQQETGLAVGAGLEGANEREGHQSVYLTGYMLQEMTLFMVISCALEELGGTSRAGPLDEENRSKYRRKISKEELAERHAEAQRELRKHKPWIIAGVILTILMIPFYFLSALIRVPLQIYRMKKKGWPFPK